MVVRYKTHESSRMPMVRPIFQAREVFGRHQIRGNARGPTEARAITIMEVRKYQGAFLSQGAGAWTHPETHHSVCT